MSPSISRLLRATGVTKFRIMTIYNLVDLELCKFMFHYVHKTLPTPLLNLFVSHDQVHSYLTRGRHNARTQEHTSTIFGKSYLARGPSLWSSLPADMKQSVSLPSFIRSFKKATFSD